METLMWIIVFSIWYVASCAICIKQAKKIKELKEELDNVNTELIKVYQQGMRNGYEQGENTAKSNAYISIHLSLEEFLRHEKTIEEAFEWVDKTWR